ncbi:MAG: hypothetical protein M3388_02395 [Acidobacteriota bacterium]|nr:hypothetical protein [Acidobacteriota bacterium]
MKFNYLVYQICVAVLFFLISTDVSIAQRSNSKIRQEVAAANQKFMAAFARGDGEVSRLFTLKAGNYYSRTERLLAAERQFKNIGKGQLIRESSR